MSDEQRFKIGDRVRCVDPMVERFAELKPGKAYRVAYVGIADLIELCGLPGMLLSPDHFRLEES